MQSFKILFPAKHMDHCGLCSEKQQGCVECWQPNRNSESSWHLYPPISSYITLERGSLAESISIYCLFEQKQLEAIQYLLIQILNIVPPAKTRSIQLKVFLRMFTIFDYLLYIVWFSVKESPITTLSSLVAKILVFRKCFCYDGNPPGQTPPVCR